VFSTTISPFVIFNCKEYDRGLYSAKDERQINKTMWAREHVFDVDEIKTVSIKLDTSTRRSTHTISRWYTRCQRLYQIGLCAYSCKCTAKVGPATEVLSYFRVQVGYYFRTT